MSILSNCANISLTPDSTSFSSLTSEDRAKLAPSGTLGEIRYKSTKNPIVVANYLFPQLLDFLSIISGEKENGCRVIVAHYMTHAVKIA